ncbi:uncharacterized protein LOC111026353 [Myzus persicae]|uniref:uncharacterized protein LOC111026353 n=1 Tax=Myzus persicae TaxID=13164 RepID=UPI000B93547D|nr:uncharacterized protein LOC111026353 [Myzus persicae]
MADLFVKTILNDLNAPEKIVNEFEAQGIDEEAFKNLTEFLLKELIEKNIGLRSKIWKKISSLKENKSSIVASSNINEDYNLFADGNLEQVQHILNNEDISTSDRIFNSNPLSNVENCVAGSSKNTDMIGLFMNSITHDNIISKTHDDINNSNIHDDISTNPIKTIYSDVTDIYRSTAFVNCDQSLQSHSKTTVIETNKISLKDILWLYHDGQLIINYFDTNQELNGYMRNKLSHLVISHSLKEVSSKKISTSKLMSLSQEIVDIFPGENKQTYYIPYRRENGKVTPTRGKLWDKYCNMRRELRNLCTTNKLQDEVISTSVNYNEELTEENILWLQNNIAPWNEVAEKWKSTFQFRYKSLSEKEKHYSYFSDIPAIKSPLGFTLIEYDFDLLYPGKDPMILFIKFELFKKKLPVYLQKNNYKGIDKLVVNEIVEPTVPGYDNVAALKTFIELFQPINVSKRTISGNLKTKYWRPSKLELKQSFIYYVNSTYQLKEVNEEKRKKAQQLDQTLQPYMIFVQDSEFENNVRDFYVIINNHFFKLESALKALDVCFKSFFSLNLNYPTESTQVWYFIQKYFFEIETNFDKNYQNINNIIHDLNNC